MSVSTPVKSLPLTCVQREIWFDCALNPEVPMYNIGGFTVIDSIVDSALFEQALHALIHQFDILSALFYKDEDLTPKQRFLCPDDMCAKVSVPLVDGAGFADEQALDDYLKQRFTAPFDIEQGPLLRFELVKLKDNQYGFLSVYHHLIVDGWSIALLHQQLAENYQALMQGKDLPQVEYSYSDYVQNDLEYLASSKYQSQKTYWLEKFKTLPEPLFAPKSAMVANQPKPSERLVLSLNRSMYDGLGQLAKTLNVSVFQLFLATLYSYFSRTANRDELVVGMPVLNRAGATFKHTAGLFVGVNAARFSFGRELNFTELCQAISKTLKQDYRYQRLPISELNRHLNHQHGYSERLFDISISYEKHQHIEQFGGAKVSSKALSHGYEQAPLMLYVREYSQDKPVDIDFCYNRGFVDKAEAQRIVEGFMLVLTQVLNNPSLALAELDLVGDKQRALLNQWNQTAFEFPMHLSVAEVFEAQAAKTPDNIAVLYSDGADHECGLSYVELNRQANRLAHLLKSKGVGRDDLVGVCLERSEQMIVAILAVLKAGGAYLPLDPQYPKERLDYLVDDAQVKVMIGEDRLLEFNGQRIDLVKDKATIAGCSSDNLPSQAMPSDLAYVIYTSGSTGKPKGVMIEQLSLVNTIYAFNHLYDTQTTDRILQQASFAFDVSVGEIFPVLGAGGTLVIPAKAVVMDPLQLADFIVAKQVSIFGATPSVLARLNFAQMPQLKFIFSGGEAVAIDNVEQLFSCAQVVNGYGPTETTIGATAYRLDVETIKGLGFVPIGKPVPNYQAYVVDEQMRRQPIGVAGELCIGGIGLARGYLHRPELTAEQFIELDIDGEPVKVYRSGDSVRFLPDGNLQYLGRIDNQVKIRGFRIELGEIESMLCRHPKIVDAVCVVKTHNNDKRLSAYFTCKHGASVELRALKAWLEDKLPHYMVPSSLNALNELPLTPNGKVDKKALPEPIWFSEQGGQVASSETELLLCSLWSSVLGNEIKTTNSHFFESGGHSLLATQLAFRINQSFATDVNVSWVFERPTLRLQAEYLDSAQRSAPLMAIPQQAKGEPKVLSFAQKRLWTLAQLGEGQDAYHMLTVLRLKGELNIDALGRAAKALVQRHQSLRMCFANLQGQAALQLIEAYQPLVVAENVQDVGAWVMSKAKAPFDLATGPLWRLDLLPTGEREHLMVFNMHHIISDGWSTTVLLDELSQLYNGYVGERDVTLPPLEIEYSDYAAWQHDYLQGEVLEALLGYWQKRLEGIPARLELPTDFPRGAVVDHDGAYLRTSLDEGLSQQIKQLASGQNCTVFMVLLSAFNVLLSRYSNQEDIVIGTPVAGRSQGSVAPLIGLFVNTLALRTELNGSEGFSDLLAQVRHNSLKDFAHQALEFDVLVDKLGVSRDLSHSPVFQVMFGCQNLDGQGSNLAGLEVEDCGEALLGGGAFQAKFELTLSAVVEPERIVLNWEYCKGLFSAERIAAMQQHFELLLRAVTEQPDIPLAQIALLSESEQQLIQQFNNTDTPVDTSQSAASLFERQALQTPDNIALYCEHSDKHLTYNELNQLANGLAQQLLAKGAGPETLVGLYAERSYLALVAMLAAFKCGAGYLPLDPNYPSQRLSYMIEDAGIGLLLRDSNTCPGQETLESIDISDITPQTTNVTSPRGGSDLAYVIYTSGSTGQPKGVVIEQVSVVNMIEAFNRLYSTTEQDRVLQQASFSFDVSVGEIWPILCRGGALYLPKRDTIVDPAALAAFIKQHDISIFGATPSLLGGLQFDALPHLRLVFSGGEALKLNNVEQLMAHAQVVNGYGPTEATVGATAYRLKPSDIERQGPVPIGVPHANYTCYVLNKDGQQQPPGIAGELYIGGIGLARHYLHRPELSAERFVEQTIFGEPQRLYKTGDLARWGNDGLEFLGRIDNQVKLRGFRIELGEIEAIIARHEWVESAAVVLFEQDENQRLGAYITLASEHTLTAQALKQWLSDKLPAYMIPAGISVLEALPLTHNGKIDTKALPEPIWFSEQGGQVASSETELLLCSLWSSVLGNEIKTTNSHFFESGGHSLLATQLAFRINQSFATDVNVSWVFERPTLMLQAEYLDSAQRSAPLMAIPQQAKGEPKVLSFAQKRLWTLAQLGEGQDAYHMLTVLRLKGELNIDALGRAAKALVQRHQSLRMCFANLQGQAALQLIEGYQPLVVAENIQDVGAWVMSKAKTPFDLATGPLWRLDLLKTGEREHLMVFNMHHIISDGWSTTVLLDELSQLYNGYVGERDVTLPPLEIEYSDYAAWQHDYLQGEVLEALLGYWQKRLEGIPARLELPTDFPRGAVVDHDGAYLRTSFDKGLSQQIKQLASGQNCTVFMVLLSAFNVLLSRYSNQEDIVIGTPVAGRSQGSVAPLIGLFVNTLALRTELNGSEGFSDLLAQVRQNSLRDFAHQALEFDVLVDKLGVSRDLSHSPVFQVMFGCQNLDGQGANLAGLEVEDCGEALLGGGAFQAKFELTLSAVVEPERIVLNWEYCKGLFSAERIAAMQQHFELLLRAVTEQPDIPLAQIALLSESEQQLIQQFNNTDTPVDTSQSAASLFERQALQTPDNIALYCEHSDKHLTYNELNQLANGLAQQLLAKGAGPETLVGLYAERSYLALVAMLAAFKCGAGYLPLDPNYPSQRLSYMIEDAGIGLLLRDSNTCPGQETLESIDISDITPQTNNVTSPRGGSDLAYVIYTSGSTGQPKGVVIEQVSVVNMIEAFNRLYSTTEQDRVLQQASFSFDVSVGEIWPILCRGGALYLPKRDSIVDPAALAAFIKQHDISIFGATPSLLGGLQFDALPHLRLVFSGGEALKLNNVEQLMAHAQVVNGYGPTEATVGATAYRLKASDIERQGPVPIGVPHANYTCYVLNKDGQQQPPGIAGELYIGGIGLARHYLHRPELSAERFVELNIFGEPQRLYKTGDLARWGNDGLEFLGRIDNQVKLRGFRIELGEIEAKLAAQPMVAEAAVKVVDEPVQSLLGYVTLADKGDEQTQLDAITAQLREQLPDYMVPKVLTALDVFPVTSNGKIDYRALPIPQLTQTEDICLPVNETELRLLKLWQQVLGIDSVGTNDSFFALGGDSILLIRLVALAKNIGLVISPNDVYRQQTIKGLAQVVKSVSVIEADQGLVTGEVPLSPIQRAFFANCGETPWHFNQSALFELPQGMDGNALKQALECIIEHHDMLRARFELNDGVWRQWIDAELPLPWQAVSVDNDEARLTLLNDIQRSLNLSEGPLLRFVHITQAAQSLLFCCVHHLLIDGVSWRIVVEDLDTAYHQVLAGMAVKLPAKTSSFKAWAKKLTKDYHHATEHWQSLIATQVPPLELDNPQAPNRFEDLAHCQLSLSEAQTKALLYGLNSRFDVSLMTALMYALVVSLSRLQRSEQLLIGLESHGRADLFDGLDVSRTVGWFTSSYSALFSKVDNLSLEQGLKTVGQDLAKVPDLGVGFGVGRYCHDMALPEAQVLFNYLGQFDQALNDSMLQLSDKPQGDNLNPSGPRSYALEFNAQVVHQRLSMTISYSAKQFNIATIAALEHRFVEALEQIATACEVSVDTTSAIALNQTQADKPLLFVFPGSGSIAGYFRGVAAQLAPHYRVYGMQSPGLDGVQTPPQSVAALAAHHVEVIKALAPNRSVCLLGHSFGTAVAFEVAQGLQKSGIEVTQLIMLDQPAIKYTRLGDKAKVCSRNEAHWLCDVAYVLQSVAGTALPPLITAHPQAHSLHHLYMSLVHWLRQTGVDKLMFERDNLLGQVKALVAVYRANALAYLDYQDEGSVLDCPITLISASETVKEIADVVPSCWGWSAHTSAEVKTAEVSGSHIGILAESAVKQLAAHIVSLAQG